MTPGWRRGSERPTSPSALEAEAERLAAVWAASRACWPRCSAVLQTSRTKLLTLSWRPSMKLDTAAPNSARRSARRWARQERRCALRAASSSARCCSSRWRWRSAASWASRAARAARAASASESRICCSRRAASLICRVMRSGSAAAAAVAAVVSSPSSSSLLSSSKKTWRSILPVLTSFMRTAGRAVSRSSSSSLDSLSLSLDSLDSLSSSLVLALAVLALARAALLRTSIVRGVDVLCRRRRRMPSAASAARSASESSALFVTVTRSPSESVYCRTRPCAADPKMDAMRSWRSPNRLAASPSKAKRRTSSSHHTLTVRRALVALAELRRTLMEVGCCDCAV
eukprot:m.285317 g.285317  ORF g.285317 m.285317 type:complete len:343 (+) comp11358_c0_seq1:718-1746(+)